MKETNTKVINTYPATAEFCEKWDQISGDPNYKSLLLKEFEPYVKKIFSRTPLFKLKIKLYLYKLSYVWEFFYLYHT